MSPEVEGNQEIRGGNRRKLRGRKRRKREKVRDFERWIWGNCRNI